MYLKLFAFVLIIHKQMLMSRFLVSDKKNERRLSFKSDKSNVGVSSRQLNLISFLKVVAKCM